MSAHDNADSQDSEATSTKMDSPAVNGHGHASLKDNGQPARSSRSPLPAVKKETSTDLNTPITSPGRTPSPDSDAIKDDPEMKRERVGGDIVVKQEPGQPPKLSRSSSQKIAARPPQLFSHLPDSTADALATFEQIDTCWYANKYMGYTEHAMECDCAEEWGMYSFLFALFTLLVLHYLRCYNVAIRSCEGRWAPFLGIPAMPSSDRALQRASPSICCFPLKISSALREFLLTSCFIVAHQCFKFFSYRLRSRSKYSLRRRLRLHQSCNQDRVRG